MHFHPLLSTVRSLDTLKFDVIVDDSFCRLNERMIMNESFSLNSFSKNGLKPKWQRVK